MREGEGTRSEQKDKREGRGREEREGSGHKPLKIPPQRNCPPHQQQV